MRRRKVLEFFQMKTVRLAAGLFCIAAVGMAGVYLTTQKPETQSEGYEAEEAKEDDTQSAKNNSITDKLFSDLKETEGTEEAKTKNTTDRQTADAGTTEEKSSITSGIGNEMTSSGEMAKADTEETEETQETEDTQTASNETAEGEQTADGTEEEAEPESAAVASSDVIAEDLELSFVEGSTCIWPVEGNVLMDFNMANTVYFSTLDQYKFNPAIVIQAEVNTKVSNAQRGVVEAIRSDAETGTTLVVDVGDDCQMVYGQLKEVPVEIGQVVESGQILGYVSEPTKYYSVEGSNLYFQVLKDGQAVDPMDYLE